jgi:methionyl-tRNA formyltransferase
VLAVDSSGILVACGEDALRLTSVKPEGRAACAAADWARGARLAQGNRLEGGKEYLK